jgi:hypothetical protein
LKLKRPPASADDDRVILSDKSPRSSATRAAETPVQPAPDPAVAKPTPKALCASCGRPVALLTAATCVYCGAPQSRHAAPKESASKIPAQMLVMLEPRPHERKRGQVWMFRAGAALIGALSMAALVGPCMRPPTAP